MLTWISHAVGWDLQIARGSCCCYGFTATLTLNDDIGSMLRCLCSTIRGEFWLCLMQVDYRYIMEYLELVEE